MSARRAWAMSQVFSDSLPQSNPSSVWASVSRADSNICSTPCEDRWFACGCRQPRRVVSSIERGHQFVELFGLHCRHQLLAQDVFGPLHRSFPHELRRLLMDKVGGTLDAVQGRLLRAKLDALRFDCHSDTSFFPQPAISARSCRSPNCTVNVRTRLVRVAASAGDHPGTTRHARCRTTCTSVNVTYHALAAKTAGDLGRRVTATSWGSSGRRFKSCQPDHRISL